MKLEKCLLPLALGISILAQNPVFADNSICQYSHNGYLRADGKASNVWKVKKGNKIYVESCLFDTFTKFGGKRYRHLLLSLAQTESSLNPNTQNGRAGEIGLMQVMPSTAKFVATEYNLRINPYDLTQNITGAALYLDYIEKRIQKYCGNKLDEQTYLTIFTTLYNSGHDRLKKGCKLPNIPSSTQRYSQKVINTYFSNVFIGATLQGK